MNINLIIADNFVPNPEEIRSRVLRSEFGEHVGPDGQTYTGISTLKIPELVQSVAMLSGVMIKPRMSFFRLNLKGEMPHCYIHADNICAEYAGLLYLNAPAQCSGGTAFWKHKELGLHSMPTPEEADALGYVGRHEDLAKRIGEDWKDKDLWEQSGFVGMRFNRFISYPTRMFHSRFPFEGFGENVGDGRVVWVCFYDL